MTVAELVAKLGVDMDRASWDKAEKGLDRLKHAAEAVVEVLGIREIKNRLNEMIGESVERAHEVQEMSETLGLTTDRVQELAYATKEVGQAGLEMALRRISVAANEATTKGGESAAMFAHFGIKVRDANGKLFSSDKLLENAADAMQRIKNPTERMAMSMQLFGRSGMAMIKVLKDGSAAMREKYDKAMRLGYVRSKESIELAVKEKEAQVDVNYATKALTDTIVDKLLPGKIWLLEKTQKLIEFFQGLVTHTRIVQEAMVALGVVLGLLAVRSFWNLLVMLGPLGVGLLLIGALIWLVYDDLTSADSVLMEFANNWRKILRDFANPDNVDPNEFWLITFFRSIVELGGKALKMMDDVANKVNRVLSIFDGITDDDMDKAAAMGLSVDEMNARRGSTGHRLLQSLAHPIDSMMGIEGPSATATVRPSGVAMAAGASSKSIAAHQELNMTVNAAPGQDAADVGNEVWKQAGGAWSSMVEDAHNQLIPSAAGLVP